MNIKALFLFHRGKNLEKNEGIGLLAKGAGISFFAEIGHVIFIWIYGILIARYLGSHDYGIFFLGITIFNLACLFALGGVEDTLIRFVGAYTRAGNKNDTDTVIRFSFLIALGAGSGIGILCFLLKDILANDVFYKPDLAIVLSYLSPAIPVFVLMTISVASIRSHKIVFPYVFVRKIFFPTILLILGGLILGIGLGLKSLSLSYLMSVVAGACLASFFLKYYLGPFTGRSCSWMGKKSYLSFLSAAYFSNILLFLFSWSDLIILGILSSPDQLGIYFAAKRTALALGILLVSLNVILGPMISHLYSGKQYEQLGHAFKTGTLWIVSIGLPILLMFLFFSGEILLIFGAEFIKGQACLTILVLGQFINLSVGSVGYMLLMTGHQKWMVFNALGAVCLNALLMVILIPRYGITGAAWSAGATLSLANLIAMVEVYFLLGVHPYSLRYFKLIFLACVTAGLTWTLKHYTGQTESIAFIIGQITFIYICFFSLLLVFGLTKLEKLKLLEIRNKPLPVLVKNFLEGGNGKPTGRVKNR